MTYGYEYDMCMTKHIGTHDQMQCMPRAWEARAFRMGCAMKSNALKELRELKMTTPEGRELQEFALRWLEQIDTKEKAFEVLKSIGIYNEDGTPNPYFFPDRAQEKK